MEELPRWRALPPPGESPPAFLSPRELVDPYTEIPFEPIFGFWPTLPRDVMPATDYKPDGDFAMLPSEIGLRFIVTTQLDPFAASDEQFQELRAYALTLFHEEHRVCLAAMTLRDLQNYLDEHWKVLKRAELSPAEAWKHAETHEEAARRRAEKGGYAPLLKGVEARRDEYLARDAARRARIDAYAHTATSTWNVSPYEAPSAAAPRTTTTHARGERRAPHARRTRHTTASTRRSTARSDDPEPPPPAGLTPLQAFTTSVDQLLRQATTFDERTCDACLDAAARLVARHVAARLRWSA
jgi:hypothetical protein